MVWIKHGLNFKKVYRVIIFEQSNWNISYIILNIKLITAAINEFEKNLSLWITAFLEKQRKELETQRHKASDKSKEICQVCDEAKLKDGYPFSKDLFAVSFQCPLDRKC